MKQVTKRWLAWFALLNIAVLFLISINYMVAMPSPDFLWRLGKSAAMFAWGYVCLAYWVQYGLIWLGLGVFLVFLHCLLPARVIKILAMLFGFVLSFSLLIDTFVYNLFHFHGFGVVASVLGAGAFHQVFVFSWLEWGFVAIVLVLLALVQWGVLRLTQCMARTRGYGLPIACVLIVSFFVVYATFSYYELVAQPAKRGNSLSYQIIAESQAVPFFDKTMHSLLFNIVSTRQLQTMNAVMIKPANQLNKLLRYPLHPLACSVPKRPLNVVFILVDAMRADMLNAVNAPHMMAFARQAWNFKNNWSGGDCTGPGIFSLFYSLPYSYWTAMEDQKKAPVLITALQKSGYQMGIYRSASMKFPAFNKTVFRTIPHLQLVTPGFYPYQRDRYITKEFKHFLNHLDPNKPFFGWLFYDSAHTYCQPVAYPTPFKPYVKTCDRLVETSSTNPAPIFNRYKNALRFVDMLVGQDLTELKAHHLLKNTVVILTSDHGDEFNDNGLGYWGHASDYTPYQLHTPMVVYWPGAKPAVFSHFTSHYDVVPLLMRRVLHCRNAIGDYSVGRPMLTVKPFHFLVAHSYIDEAFLTPHHINLIYPEGNYVVKTRKGFPLPNARFDVKGFQQMQQLQRRYFKHAVAPLR